MDNVSNSQTLLRPKVDNLTASKLVSTNSREAATSVCGREDEVVARVTFFHFPSREKLRHFHQRRNTHLNFMHGTSFEIC